MTPVFRWTARCRARTALAMAALATHAITTASVATASERAVNLRLGHFLEARHPMHRELLLPWAERVTAASGGRLVISVHPAGELGRDPPGQWRRVIEGALDVAFGLPGYTPERFPRTLLGALPGIADDAQRGTEALARTFEPHLAAEWSAVRLLALWTNAPAILLTRDRPIAAIADLRGRVIRHPTVVGEPLVRAWGATPATSRIELAAAALADGRIDAAYMDAGAMVAFGVERSGRHAVAGFPSVLGVFFLAMNLERYRALPPELRAVLDAHSGVALSCEGARIYARQDVAAMRHLGASGVTVRTPDAAFAGSLAAAARQVREDAVAALGDAGRTTLAALTASSTERPCE